MDSKNNEQKYAVVIQKMEWKTTINNWILNAFYLANEQSLKLVTKNNNERNLYEKKCKKP